MITTFFGLLMIAAAIPAFKWSRTEAAVADGDGGVATLPSTESINAHDAALKVSALDRVIKPAMGSFATKLKRITPVGMIDSMDRKILRAGLRGIWSVERVLVLKAFCVVGGVSMALLIFTSGAGRNMRLFGSGLFLLIGWFLVDFVLGRKITAREDAISKALPDLLDQVSITVEAGLGFEAATLHAIKGADNPLSYEFGRALQDVQLGVPRREALEGIIERCEVADLRLFIRALTQADKTGVPIAGVLKVQSEEVREKRRQAAEERAMRMPVKLIFPLVLFILPTLFLVIMGPAALSIMSTGGLDGGGG